MMQRWSLTNSEAGWITAIFFGAYMVAVPVLVTLTDRIDAKRVCLFGVACTSCDTTCDLFLAKVTRLILCRHRFCARSWFPRRPMQLNFKATSPLEKAACRIYRRDSHRPSHRNDMLP
ncbi:MAG: hypothetical protein ABS35_39535 [Kaistia sp. SCN 65-12]|nr:MAG: hypothetical protein ABS35_39535 [Kaistia sp. SCN 65-12]